MLFEKSGALVLHMGRERGVLRRMLSRVVGAEEQFAARHVDTHVRLGPATVAAVGYGQWFSHRRIHKYM